MFLWELHTFIYNTEATLLNNTIGTVKYNYFLTGFDNSVLFIDF